VASEQELLTPREVAELFRVDVKTVSRWAEEGRLPCIRTLGGHRRFNAATVRVMRDQMSGPSPVSSSVPATQLYSNGDPQGRDREQ